MPKRTEKEEIKKDGAQGVKNSGRGMMKGDAKLGKFLVDYKHNEKTFTLTRVAWRKMRKDAWNSQYKHPCISVVMGENSDQNKSNLKLIPIPEKVKKLKN